jgi:hypothetical protein
MNRAPRGRRRSFLHDGATFKLDYGGHAATAIEGLLMADIVAKVFLG